MICSPTLLHKTLDTRAACVGAAETLLDLYNKKCIAFQWSVRRRGQCVCSCVWCGIAGVMEVRFALGELPLLQFTFVCIVSLCVAVPNVSLG